MASLLRDLSARYGIWEPRHDGSGSMGAYMRMGKRDGKSRNRSGGGYGWLRGTDKRAGGRMRYAVRVELLLFVALACVAISRELTDGRGA